MPTNPKRRHPHFHYALQLSAKLFRKLCRDLILNEVQVSSVDIWSTSAVCRDDPFYVSCILHFVVAKDHSEIHFYCCYFRTLNDGITVITHSKSEFHSAYHRCFVNIGWHSVHAD